MSKRIGYDIYIKDEFSSLYQYHCSDAGCSLILSDCQNIFEGLASEGINPDHVDYWMYVEADSKTDDWTDVGKGKRYSINDAYLIYKGEGTE